jgi:hypothetical protein
MKVFTEGQMFNSIMNSKVVCPGPNVLSLVETFHNLTKRWGSVMMKREYLGKEKEFDKSAIYMYICSEKIKPRSTFNHPHTKKPSRPINRWCLTLFGEPVT